MENSNICERCGTNVSTTSQHSERLIHDQTHASNRSIGEPSQHYFSDLLPPPSHNPHDLRQIPRFARDDSETARRAHVETPVQLGSEIRSHRGTEMQLEPNLPPHINHDLYDLRQRTESDRVQFGTERRAHNETQVRLETEVKAHRETQLQLEETQRDLVETRARWKDVVKEFNKFQAQSQNFIQLDDQDLLQKVGQLRYNIRNLALHHFRTTVPVSPKHILVYWDAAKDFSQFKDSPLADRAQFDSWIQNHQRRAMITQAYLWAFLTEDIFDQFRWAGKDISDSLYELKSVFDSSSSNLLTMAAEQTHTERRIQTWKANTTILVVESMGLEQEQGHRLRKEFVRVKAKNMATILMPVSSTKYDELAEELSTIIMEALELDMLIHKQVARLHWLYSTGHQPQRFNQDSMELVGDPGESVVLSLAPGLSKQGKSNGDDFEKTINLLKMQVACGPSRVSSQASSHRGSNVFKWRR